MEKERKKEKKKESEGRQFRFSRRISSVIGRFRFGGEAFHSFVSDGNVHLGFPRPVAANGHREMPRKSNEIEPN